MKNLISITLGLLLGLLLAGTATAYDWKTCGAAESGTTSNTIGKNDMRCFDYNEDDPHDTTPPLLAVSHCMKYTVLYDADVDSATPGGTMNVNVYHCLEPTYSTNHCQIVLNATLSGAADDDIIWGAAAGWITVVGDGDPGTEKPRTQVTCHGGG